jgi:hypothetical protein
MIDLPGHSRVWIFQADRFLKESESEHLKKEMQPFIQAWAAHGEDLYGAFSLEYDAFLIIGADETKAPASGCSIDSLAHKIQALGDELNVDFFNRLIIAYEDPSTNIHLVTLEDFKRLLSENKINAETIVYNNLVENITQLNEIWRTKVKDSWHKNLLKLS